MRNRDSSRTASFYTLGCKLNQSETNAIQQEFVQRNYDIVPFGEPANISVINTCTVTNQADSKSRSVIRKAVKASPDGRVVVTGCYAQIRPEEIQAIEGVNLILGTAEKHHLFDYLDRAENGLEPLVFVNESGEIDSYDESFFISSSTRTRAFLKIQEGCNYYCSYCIIPFARGKARSRSYDSAIEEAKRLVDEGYREIVLTGINVGTYRHENGQITLLHDLLSGLSDINGLDRIRISSIEPNTITDELLLLVKERENICPHLHVPLQSGSNTILAAMQRKYKYEEYLEVIDRIRIILPDTALGTDVIVGHPGETDELFRETAECVMELPFTYLHIFRYSPREGTVAARMTEQVPEPVKKERSAVLREIGIKKKKKYAQRFEGQTLPVLIESQREDGTYSGLTPNYLRVSITQKGTIIPLINTIEKVFINKVNGSNLEGKLVNCNSNIYS